MSHNGCYVQCENLALSYDKGGDLKARAFIDWLCWEVGFHVKHSPCPGDPLGQLRTVVGSIGPLVLAVQWTR